MATSDATLQRVAPKIVDELDDLTGATKPSYSANAEKGHAIGIKIREAVQATFHRDNGAAE